jgi:hypothetical protein
MKSSIKTIAPWLVTAAIGGAIGLAPVASATAVATPVPGSKVVASPVVAPSPAPPELETGTDPLVPYGANPYIPFQLGEGGYYTTAGRVDLAF